MLLNDSDVSAALRLLRHKMLVQLRNNPGNACLYYEDVNEVFVTAGLPVIVPTDIHEPELKVIATGREVE